MLKKYEKIFSQIGHPVPAAGLLARILSRIESEKELMTVRRKIFWLSAFSIASLPVIVFSWINFQTGASESGLFQLASLAFTDFSAIASHYQDFAMSIVEALPILSIAGLLAGALIFVESSLTLARNAKFVYEMSS